MSAAAHGLGFSFGGRMVLNGVALEAPDGCFLSILGSNGAGKSTLLRCMAGLLTGYAGKVEADGQDIRHMSRRELAGRVAYIPQTAAHTFHFTVLEMALMGATAGGSLFASPGMADRERAIDALDTVGIAELADRDFLRISGGERQLTLIARALAARAKTLLLDEPTSSLDYGNQFRVLDKLRGLAESGCAILMTTHNPEHAAAFSHRAASLKDARLTAYAKPGDVLADEVIMSLYGTPRWNR